MGAETGVAVFTRDRKPLMFLGQVEVDPDLLACPRTNCISLMSE
jgi:hypothetical protein